MTVVVLSSWHAVSDIRGGSRISSRVEGLAYIVIRRPLNCVVASKFATRGYCLWKQRTFCNSLHKSAWYLWLKKKDKAAEKSQVLEIGDITRPRGSTNFIWVLKVSLTSERSERVILSAREDKIRIPKRPCNVLFITYIVMKFPRKRQLILFIFETAKSGHLLQNACHRNVIKLGYKVIIEK